MAPRAIWAFASGSNSPGKIVGSAMAGFPPGVALLRWEDGAWKWDCGSGTGATPSARACWFTLLETAQKLKTPVFVDSGAFAEMGAPEPIPPGLWREVLAHQLALARAVGPLAVVVLPDKVGDQGATLRRLRRYRDQVAEILDAGARGVVVLHKGRRSDASMAREISEALVREDWVIGFPTVRAKREPSEIRAVLDALPYHPVGVHLLGIGPASARWPEYLSALGGLPADTWVSSDAVLHRRFVGRPHVGPRGRRYKLGPLTEQQNIARQELFEEAWAGVYEPLVGEMLDPTEQLPAPSDWMPRGVARQIAAAGARAGLLTQNEAATFTEDPTRGRELVMERDEPGAEWWLDNQIEVAWWQRVQALSAQTREVRARTALFGARAPAPEVVPEFAQLEVEVVGSSDGG